MQHRDEFSSVMDCDDMEKATDDADKHVEDSLWLHGEVRARVGASAR